MKVVLFENPEQHKSTVATKPRTVWPDIETWTKVGGGESELVKSLEDAELRLAQGGVDWLVIHHHNFDDIDMLKSKYPDVKYAGIGANLLEKKFRREGSCVDSYWKEMKKHYDFLLPNFDYSILEMMNFNVKK